MEARIYEQGNGLPDAGDYCWGAGVFYRVVAVDSRVFTGARTGNYILATVREAELEECSEEDEHTARVEVVR